MVEPHGSPRHRAPDMQGRSQVTTRWHWLELLSHTPRPTGGHARLEVLGVPLTALPCSPPRPSGQHPFPWAGCPH